MKTNLLKLHASALRHSSSIDQDGNSKLQRKEKLEEILGDRLIILPCREVENLLPYYIIKQVVLEYERDESKELPDKEYDLYKDKPLGRYIEDTMLKKLFIR